VWGSETYSPPLLALRHGRGLQITVKALFQACHRQVADAPQLVEATRVRQFEV
jgi:hypothetical protein